MAALLENTRQLLQNITYQRFIDRFDTPGRPPFYKHNKKQNKTKKNKKQSDTGKHTPSLELENSISMID